MKALFLTVDVGFINNVGELVIQINKEYNDALEKLVLESLCTREKIQVSSGKENIAIKEFIESMFPDVEYTEIKKTFEIIYQND